MNNNQHEGQENRYYEDEISISDILQKIWQRRGIVVICPILFFIMGVSFILLTAVKTNTPTIYYIQLKGIERGTYPNGAHFSPEDLLIPEVLHRAVKSLNIPVDEDLRKAIQVEYGTPATAAIHIKYRNKLSERLELSEIERINREYQAELESIGRQGLRIIIDHASLGLSAEQGAVLAIAIPRAWTDIYSTKYRVFIDTRLSHVQIIDRENDLESPSDIFVAHHSLQKIKQGLNMLTEDHRLQAIVSQSGFNSADLQNQLTRFKMSYFWPMFSVAFSDPDVVVNSFINETQFKIDDIDRVIQELDRSLSDIRSFNVRTDESNLIDRPGSSIEFSADTFNELIALANRASLSDYIQEILTARRVLVTQQSALKTEIARTKHSIVAIDDSFFQIGKDEFNFLLTEYSSLLNTARELRRQVQGDFYQPLGAPFVIKSLLPPRTHLILSLSVMLGIFLSLMITLAWPQRKLTQ